MYPEREQKKNGVTSRTIDRKTMTAHRWLLRFLLLAWAGTMPSMALAAQPGAGKLCDDAARSAARGSGVPLSILLAITRVETGRQGEDGIDPWPWAVNLGGQGHWFSTETAAWRFVYDAFRGGARDFDIGCFQINYHWHGSRFSSIEAMFDPFANAHYAATFLMELYRETGDWDGAVRAYHSRTPEKAALYATRFAEVLSRIEPAKPWIANGLADNSGDTAGPGSLVRFGLGVGGRRAILSPRVVP